MSAPSDLRHLDDDESEMPADVAGRLVQAYLRQIALEVRDAKTLSEERKVEIGAEIEMEFAEGVKKMLDAGGSVEHAQEAAALIDKAGEFGFDIRVEIGTLSAPAS